MQQKNVHAIEVKKITNSYNYLWLHIFRSLAKKYEHLRLKEMLRKNNK